jgi:glutathione synthase/RimK-type ligase-like ATP-grasp enzyme
MYPSVKILKKSCKKFNYEFSIIDKVTHNLFQVSNWYKYFFANNQWTGMFPINNHFSARVVADKAFCYQILNKHWFNIPKWNHFFINDKFNCDIFTDNKKSDIKNFIKKLGYPVFIKPNNGSLWKWADVIYDKKELKNHIEVIRNIWDICIVQEYIKAPEFRIFVVNGEIQFSYKRSAASIKWDWKSNINSLLKKSWNNFIKKSKFFLTELEKNNLKLGSILLKNQTISLHSKTNISAWGDISELKTKHGKKVKKWAKNLVSKFDIWVTGIDVFAPNGINSPKDFIIIELNSNPSLVGTYKLWYKKLVIKTWKKILESYFWENKLYNKNRKYRKILDKKTEIKKSKKIKSSI